MRPERVLWQGDREVTAIPKDCLFCKIAQELETGHKVLDEDLCVAFLDIRPLFPGHCLVIPRRHVGTLADLPSDLVEPLFSRARLLARAVEETMQAEGTFIAINNKVSQSVAHLHIHVVPRQKGDGLRGFFWPRNPYRDRGHLADVQGRIAKRVQDLLSEPSEVGEP